MSCGGEENLASRICVIFGAAAYLHVPAQRLQHAKLSDRAEKGVFIGYSKETKGYHILVPPSHRLVIARSVIFDEDKVVKGSDGC